VSVERGASETALILTTTTHANTLSDEGFFAFFRLFVRMESGSSFFAPRVPGEETTVTDDDLLRALRDRRAEAAARIDMDTLPVPALFQVATSAQLADAERQIGLRLPDLLKRVYAEVGNGGFGPGGGLIGVEGGYPDANGRLLPASYGLLRADGWPEKLLPLWDWGCASWSCVDAATTDGDIVTMGELGRTLTPFSLRSWLEQWAKGTDLHDQIYELGAATILNPFTRKPMEIKRLARPRGTRVD
jgi:hypothetical protein